MFIQDDFLLLMSAILAVLFAESAFALGREPGIRLKWNWLGAAFLAWAAQTIGSALAGHYEWHWLYWTGYVAESLWLLLLLECTRRSLPWIRYSRLSHLIIALLLLGWASLVLLADDAARSSTNLRISLLAFLLIASRVQGDYRWSERRGDRILAAALAAALLLWLLAFGLIPSLALAPHVRGFCLPGCLLLLVLLASLYHGRRLRKRLGAAQTRGLCLLHFAVMFLGALFSVVLGGLIIDNLTRTSIVELRSEAVGRDSLLARRLSDSAQTLENLASLAAHEPQLIQFMSSRQRQSLESATEAIARHIAIFGVDAYFFVDPAGIVLAARTQDRLMNVAGKSIASRPYFRTAVAGELAVEISAAFSGNRGLYGAAPIRNAEGAILGVLVVRQELEFLALDLQQYDNVFLVREDGLIALSSRPEWLHRSLWRAGSAPSAPDLKVGITSSSAWSEGATLTWENHPMLVGRSAVAIPGWSIVSLQSLESVQRTRGLGMALTVAAACAATGAATMLRLAQETRLAAQEHQEVENTLKAMESVVAAMAHDLRTPLTSIRALAEYQAMVTPPLPANAVRDLQTIVHQTERMTSLINSTLDSVRLRTADGDARQWSSVDMPAVIDAAVRTITPLVNGAQVKIAQDVPAGLSMQGDALALQRLVTNLLSNACRHTQEGSIQVSATTRRRGEHSWILLGVSDTGRGIPDNKLPLLGKPFALGGQRAPQSSARGIGLGLAITRDICEAHGGLLRVKTKLGRGTSFTAELCADLSKPLPVRGLGAIEIDT